jgi:hypothetical protein
LRIVTGGVSITSADHLQSETRTLPLADHLTMLAAQFLTQTSERNHPCHNSFPLSPPPPRMMKKTIQHFQPVRDLLISSHQLNQTNHPVTLEDKLHNIHTTAVQQHIKTAAPNPILNGVPPRISVTERYLPRRVRTRLSQLRSSFSPALNTYHHRLNPHISPACPSCDHPTHDTTHLFQCPAHPTSLSPVDLWLRPRDVMDFLNEHWSTWLQTGRIRP